MKTKTILTFIVIGLVLLARLSFAQDIKGVSSNLCPKNVNGYTYNSTAGCAPNLQDWVVQGGKIISQGNTATLGDFIIVEWNNVTSGLVHNSCGTLNVSILGIEQPAISPGGTKLLCGSNKITLVASVYSTSNITGYQWHIEGTGISPTGNVNTTDPQLTLTYTDWTVSNPKSATVAVGTMNSCGFKTRVVPLTNTDIDTAIPRSAWIQLSTGNINDLLVPYTFSPTTVCGNTTMQVTNQPSGSSIAWSSNNTFALNFSNQSTGEAIRVNNYTGPVTVTATLSNACGSNTESSNIWIGLPRLVGLTDNGNSLLPSQVCAGNTDFFETYLDSNYPQGTYYYVGWSGANVNISSYGAPNASVYYSGTVGSYASVTATISNLCGQYEGNETWIGQIVDCGGGGSQNSSIYPNPSDELITIKTQSFSKAEPMVSIRILNAQDETMYQNEVAAGSEVSVQVKDWPKGTYYLKMSDGKKDKNERLVINH